MIKVIVDQGLPEILTAAKIKSELGCEPLISLPDVNVELQISKIVDDWTTTKVVLATLSGEPHTEVVFHFNESHTDHYRNVIKDQVVKIVSVDLKSNVESVYELKRTEPTFAFHKI